MKAEPRVLLGATLLGLAVLAAYSGTGHAPFVFDDLGSIPENPSIRHLAALGEVLRPPSALTVSGRPLLNLSLALNYAAGGVDPWGYHLVNLLIHLGSGLTLFGIVRRTSRSLGFAFSVAFLWALHPLQTESVTYVVQRAESLMGLFYLLTLYGFIRATRPWLLVSVVACLLGMATKEVMVSAPIIVLLYDRTFLSGSFRAAWSARRGYYLALAATWIVLAWDVAAAGDRGGSAGFGQSFSALAYARIQVFAVAHYLRLALWPRPLVFYYGHARGGGAALFALDAAVLGALGVATIAGLRKRSALGFLGVAFFAVLAPSSSVVPVATETMAEHRFYLPLAVVLIAALGLVRKVVGPRSTVALALVWGAGLAALTAMRNETYADDLRLWSDTVAKVPDNPVAHNDRGEALRTRGRLEEAASEYRAALRINPGYADAYNNLGVALAALGRRGEAADAFRQALRLEPRSAKARLNWGGALQEAGDLEGAIGQYRQAERLDPESEPAALNLGKALMLDGQAAAAAAELARAVALDPSDAEAHDNLGAALANLGRWAEARAQFEEALRLRPDYAAARANLRRLP